MNYEAVTVELGSRLRAERKKAGLTQCARCARLSSRACKVHGALDTETAVHILDAD